MAISKSRRFEVFKRDGFVCQYCGRRPPDVLLEVDHIEPRANGGTDEDGNLITSCEDCNRGKAARPLTEVRPRPDADIAYLQLQQEITEARRWQEAVASKEETLKHTVVWLQHIWQTYVTDVLDWVPHERILRQMINRYPHAYVEAAVRDVATKEAGGYIKGSYVPYMWTVLRNMQDEGLEANPDLCSDCGVRLRADLCDRCNRAQEEEVDLFLVREVTRLAPRAPA